MEASGLLHCYDDGTRYLGEGPQNLWALSENPDTDSATSLSDDFPPMQLKMAKMNNEPRTHMRTTEEDVFDSTSGSSSSSSSSSSSEEDEDDNEIMQRDRNDSFTIEKECSYYEGDYDKNALVNVHESDSLHKKDVGRAFSTKVVKDEKAEYKHSEILRRTNADQNTYGKPRLMQYSQYSNMQANGALCDVHISDAASQEISATDSSSNLRETYLAFMRMHDERWKSPSQRRCSTDDVLWSNAIAEADRTTDTKRRSLSLSPVPFDICAREKTEIEEVERTCITPSVEIISVDPNAEYDSHSNDSSSSSENEEEDEDFEKPSITIIDIDPNADLSNGDDFEVNTDHIFDPGLDRSLPVPLTPKIERQQLSDLDDFGAEHVPEDIDLDLPVDVKDFDLASYITEEDCAFLPQTPRSAKRNSGAGMIPPTPGRGLGLTPKSSQRKTESSLERRMDDEYEEAKKIFSGIKREINATCNPVKSPTTYQLPGEIKPGVNKVSALSSLMKTQEFRMVAGIGGKRIIKSEPASLANSIYTSSSDDHSDRSSSSSSDSDDETIDVETVDAYSPRKQTRYEIGSINCVPKAPSIAQSLDYKGQPESATDLAQNIFLLANNVDNFQNTSPLYNHAVETHGKGLGVGVGKGKNIAMCLPEAYSSDSDQESDSKDRDPDWSETLEEKSVQRTSKNPSASSTSDKRSRRGSSLENTKTLPRRKHPGKLCMNSKNSAGRSKIAKEMEKCGSSVVSVKNKQSKSNISESSKNRLIVEPLRISKSNISQTKETESARGEEIKKDDKKHCDNFVMKKLEGSVNSNGTKTKAADFGNDFLIRHAARVLREGGTKLAGDDGHRGVKAEATNQNDMVLETCSNEGEVMENSPKSDDCCNDAEKSMQQKKRKLNLQEYITRRKCKDGSAKETKPEERGESTTKPTSSSTSPNCVPNETNSPRNVRAEYAENFIRKSFIKDSSTAQDNVNQSASGLFGKPSKVFDPIGDASRKALMLKKSKIVPSKDVEDMIPVVPPSAIVPLEVLSQNDESKTISELPRRLNPDYEEIILVSVGVNTIISRPLIAGQSDKSDESSKVSFKLSRKAPLNDSSKLLEENNDGKQMKINPKVLVDITDTIMKVVAKKDVKISSNSLFSSIQDVVMKKASPHASIGNSPRPVASPGKNILVDAKIQEISEQTVGSLTTSTDMMTDMGNGEKGTTGVTREHGEDKVIMHLRKDRVRCETATIACQADLDPSFRPIERLQKPVAVVKKSKDEGDSGKHRVKSGSSNGDSACAGGGDGSAGRRRSGGGSSPPSRRRESRSRSRNTRRKRKTTSGGSGSSPIGRRHCSRSPSRRSRYRGSSPSVVPTWRRFDRRQGRRRRTSYSPKRGDYYSRSSASPSPRGAASRRSRSRNRSSEPRSPSPDRYRRRSPCSTSSNASSSTTSSRSRSCSRSPRSTDRSRPRHHRTNNNRYRSSESSSYRNREDFKSTGSACGGEAGGSEERRIVFVGHLEADLTKHDVRRRFRRYGEIVNVTLHKKESGVRYGFVTFERPQDAYDAIERGSRDPLLRHYDIGFGGRRKFCDSMYADLDGVAVMNYQQDEYMSAAPIPRTPATTDSFHTLLAQMKETLNSKKNTAGM